MRPATTTRGLYLVPVLTMALLGAMLSDGCRSAAPGVTNQMGTLDTVVSAAPPRVVRATEQAMQDLELILVSKESTAIDGVVVARTAQDKRVSVQIKKLTDTTSRVRIRVGTLGDQDLGLTILDKIKSKL